MDSSALVVCKLCGQLKPLQDSHIMPEFVFRPAYDATHTAIKIDMEREKKAKQQKGFTERLLCKSCEGIFSKWENYFSRIWFHKIQRLRPVHLNDEIIRIPGIDYVAFKLFHLSIIWRSGISSRSEFKNVRLGTQEIRLRKLLKAQDPGDPDEYPMMGLALREPDTKTFYDRLLRAPEVSRYNGYHVYSYLFGGVTWAYFISGNRIESILNLNCIRRDGVLTLAVQDWNKNPSIQELAGYVQKNRAKFL